MPFSAINTYELELKQRNDQHTLEIQLEKAMLVYQSALNFQRLGQFEASFEDYQKLFTFDVIQPAKLANKGPQNAVILEALKSGDENSVAAVDQNLQLGPAIRLRAMALKNFSLLLLSQPQVEVSQVNEALGYLSEALELVGVEDHEKLVLPCLAQVMWALGFCKESRLALEILSQNNESGSLQPWEVWKSNHTAAEDLFGPRTIEILHSLDFLENNTRSKPSFLNKFKSLSDLKDSQLTLVEFLEQESKLTVTLVAKSWESLVQSISDSLNGGKKAKRKTAKDNYASSARDIWQVDFDGILFNNNNNNNRTELNSYGSSLETHVRDPKTPCGSPPQSPALPQSNILSQSPQPQLILAASSEAQPSKILDPLESVSASPEVIPGTPTDGSPQIASPRPGSPHRSISPTPFSPAKRRRTDRMKRTALALPADFGNTDAGFVAQFNAYLVLANSVNTDQPEFFSPAYLFLEQNQEGNDELSGAAELRDLLANWDSRESTQFMAQAASSRPQAGGIMATLRKGNSFGSADSSDIPSDEGDDELYNESLEVDEFVTRTNNMHFQQVRWELAQTLLLKLAYGGQSPRFAKVVFKLVNECESMMYSRRTFLPNNCALMLYSLYADMWIQNHNAEYLLKLQRWQQVSAMEPQLAHMWITSFVDQEDKDASPEFSVIQFGSILKHLKDTKIPPDLLSHLVEIPQLTISNVQMQISKFKAASAFERVLAKPDQADENHKAENFNDDIKLLEAMLMPENHTKPASTSDSEFEAILNFIEFSQPQFKMGLWYILLEKYERSGSKKNSLTGLTNIFMEAQQAFGKGEPLLQILSVAHDVGTRLVGLLERSPSLLIENMPFSEAQSVLIEIVKLLQILHLFLLYDEAVNSNLMQKPVVPSWSKASAKFRELVVIWWCLFYRFWFRCIPESVSSSTETVNDIISIIHERLGNLGYCGVANGCLLTLHINEICRMSWEGSALDICQCLKCKFGLNLALHGEVLNHHTVSQKLQLEEANLILPFVMRMILNHRSYNQIVMRTDTRSVIDEFAQVLEVRQTPRHISRISMVKEFLNKDFCPDLLRASWQGSMDPKLAYGESDDGEGLWCVQANIILNQYRMRRRQTYSPLSVKSETLNTAIDLFIDDLASRPTRFESWVGLAQANLFLCEDCLTFGDESSVPNKPDYYCRQALLASSQAIALKVGERLESKLSVISVAQSELADSLSSTIWGTFGYLLVLAVMAPLESLPFKNVRRPMRPILVTLSDPNIQRFGVQKPSIVDDNLALRIAIKCLSKSSDVQLDWVYALYQTTAAIKLDLEAPITLKYARRAFELCSANSTDAEVEYLYVIWRYWRSNKLTESEAKKSLKFLESVEKMLEANPALTSLELVKTRLETLADKDKWSHRPRFLLSELFRLDYSDNVRAQEELLHLFSLKSPTKPLVIWKSDGEFPGQYRVSMATYTEALADLMFSNRDSKGLLLMARRFRKTGLEMWHHAQTCDYVYIKACDLVKLLVNLSPTRSQLIGEINGDSEIHFENVVKVMADNQESWFKDSDRWVQALNYSLELRKNHPGLSALAASDEVVISIFLTMYKNFVDQHRERLRVVEKPTATADPQDVSAQPSLPQPSPQPEAPNENKKPKGKSKENRTSSKKKVVRKDVVVAAQQFMKQFQAVFSKVDDASIPTSFAQESVQLQ